MFAAMLARVSQELAATARVTTLTHREAQGHWLLLLLPWLAVPPPAAAEIPLTDQSLASLRFW